MSVNARASSCGCCNPYPHACKCAYMLIVLPGHAGHGPPERWGRPEDVAAEPQQVAPQALQPNLGLSGKLAAETNKVWTTNIVLMAD